MTAERMWDAYCEQSRTNRQTPHEAWCFGGDSDALAALVFAGIKTATASLLGCYEAGGERVPETGDYSVLRNRCGDAVCVIRNTKVTRVRFCDVGGEHAYREGEGDRSLAYWRRVHRDFFAKEASENGLPFDEASLVLCEEFEVVYRPRK